MSIKLIQKEKIIRLHWDIFNETVSFLGICLVHLGTIIQRKE